METIILLFNYAQFLLRCSFWLMHHSFGCYIMEQFNTWRKTFPISSINQSHFSRTILGYKVPLKEKLLFYANSLPLPPWIFASEKLIQYYNFQIGYFFRVQIEGKQRPKKLFEAVKSCSSTETLVSNIKLRRTVYLYMILQPQSFFSSSHH